MTAPSRSEPTVRSLIGSIQVEVRDTEVDPGRAAELVTKLTVLYAAVLDVVTKREMEFNEVLSRLMDEDMPANRAKIRAQTTDEYQALREAQNVEKSTLQLIQSLKTLVKLRQEEMRLG
jgi:hypothetical protein